MPFGDSLIRKMINKTVLVFFLSCIGLAQAQDTTPIAKYAFQTDSVYQNQLKVLKERYQQTKDLEVLDLLANLAFEYKDWETSIVYAEKAVKFEPTAKRHFLLGGVAGFRALEVSMFSSLKYINIMKPAFEEAARRDPANVIYLRAQVDVLVALPTLLGGNLDEAYKITSKIKYIDPLEGLLAEGSIYEQTKDFSSAYKTYQKVFEFLEMTYPRCSALFIDYLRFPDFITKTYKELDESDDESVDIHEALSSIIGWQTDEDWMSDEMKLWRKSQRISEWWELCDEAVTQWLQQNDVVVDDDDDLDLISDLTKFLHHFSDWGYCYNNNQTVGEMDKISLQRIAELQQ